MTPEEYWNSEGVRMLNPDGTLPSVEQRVKEGYQRGWENAWAKADELDVAMNQPQTPDNEVARLQQYTQNMQEIIDDDTKQKTQLHNEVARLRAAAQAVVDRWETPLWKDAEPTASVIYRLRDALAPAPEETQDGAIHAWRCPHCLTMWEGNYIPKGFQCPQCNGDK
jgi:rubrerythrin